MTVTFTVASGSQITLRAKLSLITENSAFYANLVSRIEHLRSATGHTIELLSSEGDDLGYNCVAYAFDLDKKPEYRKLAGQWNRDDAPADPEFIQHMIDCKEMAEQKDWSVGLLCVYFQEQTIKHIGLFVSDSRLRSKWGPGFLYEHSALEVPQEYGNCVRAFSVPDQAATLERFVAFANAKKLRTLGAQ